MKVILFLLIVLLDYSFCQDYYFSELQGFNDRNGKTHLFYKINGYYSDIKFTDENIYHYDTNTHIDSIFLESGLACNGSESCYSTWIDNVLFMDDDPDKYFYIRFGCGFDCVYEFFRYDQKEEIYSGGWGYIRIFNSRQNDSLFFIGESGRTRKSTDGGYTWKPFLEGKLLISVNPYNDNNLFVIDSEHDLAHTTDEGNTFFTSDTGTYGFSSISYDSDRKHIYLMSGNTLKMSDNNGELNSWQTIYEASDPGFFSISLDSIPGKIFITDGEVIYFSENYGKTFQLYKVLEDGIIGIHKKPFSDILYAATSKNIYEIKDSVQGIIKTATSRPLIHFPLAIGNQWDFEENIQDGSGNGTRDTVSMIIVADTVMGNGMKYFRFNSSSPIQDLIRANSYGVYFYDLFNLREWLFYKFEKEVCSDYPDCKYDSVAFGSTQYFRIFKENDSVGYMFSDTTRLISYFVDREIDNTFNITLSAEYGFQSLHYPSPLYNDDYTLIGCRLSGVTYGTVTEVNDETNSKPLEYYLFQNYPNPFNPITNFEFRLKQYGKTTIKVFDILGNEVAVILNKEMPAGEHKIAFDGSHLPSGVYFYELHTGEFVAVKKMLLVK